MNFPKSQKSENIRGFRGKMCKIEKHKIVIKHVHVTKTRPNVMKTVQNVTFWYVRFQHKSTILYKNAKHKHIT